MADDPRLLEAADFVKADAAGPATAADIEVATDMLRELDWLDPLRALLADEDQAVEIGANARYLATTVSAEPDWDRQSARAKDAYRDQVRPAIAAVLATLREVAGL